MSKKGSYDEDPRFEADIEDLLLTFKGLNTIFKALQLDENFINMSFIFSWNSPFNIILGYNPCDARTRTLNQYKLFWKYRICTKKITYNMLLTRFEP